MNGSLPQVVLPPFTTYFEKALTLKLQLFYHRLSFLPGQYAGLMEALDLYVSALSAGKVEFRALEWLPPASKDVRKDVQGCLRRLTRRPVLYRNFPDINLK